MSFFFNISNILKTKHSQLYFSYTSAVTQSAEVAAESELTDVVGYISALIKGSDNDGLQVTSPDGAWLRDLTGSNVTVNMKCDHQSTIAVQDLAGNTTIVDQQNIMIDRTPPSVTVTYESGKYVLTVSDNESGVWKITNRDGTVVYRDFS